MNILSFVYTKLSAEKTAAKLEKAQANTDVKITSVTKEKTPLSSDVLKFTSSFSVNYSTLGKTVLEGFVLVNDVKDSDKVVENWKKANQAENEIAKTVLNVILYNCNIKALELSHSVGLPSHINLPLIKKS